MTPDAGGRDALSGLIERVTYHNEESGFAVLRVKVKGRRELVTVVGNLPVVHAGEWITADGAWARDRDHGMQFRAERVGTQTPASADGIEKYLASGLIKGIGPVLAKRLVERFGEKVFDVIESESGRLEEIEGLGREKRRSIKDAWQEQRAVREIMVFLYANGISPARAVRVFRVYGPEAIERIRSDPYRLARDIAGIGFRSADAVGEKIGIAKDSLLRIRAGIDHALGEASGEGHCAAAAGQLITEVARLLGVDSSLTSDAIDVQVSAGSLVREVIGGQDLLFLPALHFAEEVIAARMAKLAVTPPEHPPIDCEKAIEWAQAKTGKSLSQSQRLALGVAIRSRITVITGGPGVGKTTLVNSILRILRAKQVRCVLCAPTGRAARRLAESTGLEARTIHRLLEVRREGGFARDESNPLDGDLIVVDELSMVDVPLMSRLLRAMPRNASLLLVGDADQLPSVGPGSVLRDIIASGAAPVARLETVFRQAGESRIISAANDVNAGRIPDLDSPPHSDFFFVERDQPEDAARLIQELVSTRIPQRYGFDPRRDIQVLSPMNRGHLGVRNLNALLQSAINPQQEGSPSVQVFGTEYHPGDKIIQTRNDYDKEVYNGDIGLLRRIDTGEREAIAEFDGREVRYDFPDFDELELAYAITVHKSQGSEFPCVIVPLATEHYLLLQRNLLYTAITRGRKLVILVGQKKALAMAVRNNAIRERHSGLLSRLEKAIKAGASPDASRT